MQMVGSFHGEKAVYSMKEVAEEYYETCMHGKKKRKRPEERPIVKQLKEDQKEQFVLSDIDWLTQTICLPEHISTKGEVMQITDLMKRLFRGYSLF